MTFTEISQDICDRLGLTSSTDVARVGRAINRKYKEITSSIGIRHVARRTTVQANMTMGVSELTFTSCEHVIEVYNRNVTPYLTLKQVTVEELRDQMPFNASESPTQYAVAAQGSDFVTILLNCNPQTALLLYADVHGTKATLSGSDEPAFPESYHDVLVSAVLIDEYMKLEKPSLSMAERDRVYGNGQSTHGRMGELRHWFAVSTTQEITQGKNKHTFGSTGSAASGSSSGVNGALAYSQTGLMTFDRDPLAPFGVSSGSAVVPNLDADLLDGLHAIGIIDLAVPAAVALDPAVNIKLYGAVCDGVTNDDTAILDTISAGYKRIFLPKNTLWIPTSDTVPGNVEYVGEDWRSVVIKSSNVAAAYITVGVNAHLYNVGIYDKYGADQPAVMAPMENGNVNEARPIRRLSNVGNTAIISTHYALQDTLVHCGGAAIEAAGIAVNGTGTGDAFFTAAAEDSVGLRVWANFSDPLEAAKGILVQCFGTGPGIQVNGGNVPAAGFGFVTVLPTADGASFYVQPSVQTTNDIVVSHGAKTSGQMINLSHTSSTMTGNGITMNFAAGAGAFSGNFIDCQANSVSKFSVGASGQITHGALTEIGAVGPPQITSNQDNYNPTGLSTARTLLLSSDASRNITGIAAQADGRVIRLVNTGSQNIVLKNLTTSTATNQFACPGNVDFTLNQFDSVEIRYVSSVWYVLGS